MQDSVIQLLSVLLGSAAALALAGLIAVLLVRLRRGRVVGRPLARECPRKLDSLLLLVAYAAGLTAAILLRDTQLLFPSMLALHASLLVILLHPQALDRACSERGVHVGWYVRSLAELEEWRLTGDHLRFRLHGQWISVPLPVGQHPAMRARLAHLIPERESKFSDLQGLRSKAPD